MAKENTSAKTDQLINTQVQLVQKKSPATTPQNPEPTATIEYDLHGYYPGDLYQSKLVQILVKQAWEMGAQELILIHGHGHNRFHYYRRFIHTNTGALGLAVRSILRGTPELRAYMYVKFKCWHDGSTTVRLRQNPSVTRNEFEIDSMSMTNF